MREAKKGAEEIKMKEMKIQRDLAEEKAEDENDKEGKRNKADDKEGTQSETDRPDREEKRPKQNERNKIGKVRGEKQKESEQIRMDNSETKMQEQAERCGGETTIKTPRWRRKGNGQKPAPRTTTQDRNEKRLEKSCE